MDNDTFEIKALKRIVWRTAISGRVERFATLLETPEALKHFGESFVTQISEKINRLFRVTLILAAVYAVLMLSLLAAQDPNKSEFQILGYSFKNLGYYKEFLLFAAASLSPISSAISAYHRYLSELRKAALRKLFLDPEVREFATHIYAGEFTDPLVKDRLASDSRPHAVTNILAVSFVFILLALLAAVICASFILQVAVIYDVATNPSSSPYINRFIVVFSLSAIVLSWFIGILQLPLPEVDLGAYKKLSALRESDRTAYNETMSRLAADSARRERAWSIGSSVGIFVLSYSASAFLFFPEAQLSLGRLLTGAIPGIALAVFVATFLAPAIKRVTYRSYFRRFPEGSDVELKAFSKATKFISAIRLVLATSVSIGYSAVALGTV